MEARQPRYPCFAQGNAQVEEKAPCAVAGFGSGDVSQMGVRTVAPDLRDWRKYCAAYRPILCTRSDGKKGYRYIADQMLKERKRLGLEAHDLHALRYRGVRALASAGCTDDEIASYSDHIT